MKHQRHSLTSDFSHAKSHQVDSCRTAEHHQRTCTGVGLVSVDHVYNVFSVVCKRSEDGAMRNTAVNLDDVRLLFVVWRLSHSVSTATIWNLLNRRDRTSSSISWFIASKAATAVPTERRGYCQLREPSRSSIRQSVSSEVYGNQTVRVETENDRKHDGPRHARPA